VKSVYNNVCACVCNVNRFSTYSHDLGVAAGTGGCKELPIAVLTVNIILLLHKADISQRCVAIMAVELLWMPGTTQCHQEWSPVESKKTNKKKNTVASGLVKIIPWIIMNIVIF